MFHCIVPGVPPSGSFYSMFIQFLGKSRQNNRVAPLPLGLALLSLGNPRPPPLVCLFFFLKTPLISLAQMFTFAVTVMTNPEQKRKRPTVFLIQFRQNPRFERLSSSQTNSRPLEQTASPRRT